MTTTLCESCAAEIRWVTLESGRPMPLDPAPHPNGNIIVGIGGRYRVLDGSQLPAEVAAWRSHFATCPHASRHRRRPVTRPPAPEQHAPAVPDADTTDEPATALAAADDQLALFDTGTTP